jgi:hypothetical protein
MLLVAIGALGAMAYFVLAPGHPTQAGPAVQAKPKTNNRAYLISLKKQLADEQEALARSIYNHATTAGDVTKGTASYSPENRARATRIEELRRKIASIQ